MYLVSINPKTGLLELGENNDGLLAIKEFRVILDIEELGLQCLTAIALVADYQSPKRFYNMKDRPRAAMEEVTGERDKFIWKRKEIQDALIKYDALQYDPTLEEGKIHYQRKVNKLREFSESEKMYGKGHKGPNGEELTFRNPATVAKELRDINADIKYFEEQVQGKDIYEKSPVKQGYTLSRLEQLVDKKNSFYQKVR